MQKQETEKEVLTESPEQYEKTGYLTEDFRMFHLKDCVAKEFAFHYHDFYKIIFFISGNVTYKIEGKNYKLKPHDFVLVDYHAIHKAEIATDMPYERYIVYLSEHFMRYENEAGEMMRQCFTLCRQHRNSVVHFAPGSYEKLLGALERIEKETKQQSGYLSEKMLEAAFLEFMVGFNRTCMEQPKAFITTASYNEKIVDVIAYIQEFLMEDITIDSLAERFFISRYYLMRQFKEATGYSIHQYINEKRILEARRQILSGVPATKVCYDCGFADYSTFARRFKEIVGTAPSKVQENEK